MIAPAWPWATRFVPSSGIDRDVDPLGRNRVVRLVPPDLLADEEHGRLVALPLADDDPPGELDLVHRPAHRLDGRSVRLILLAAAHEPRGSKRRRLSDADHLERKELFHYHHSGWSGAGSRSARKAGPST